jgi:hypothetical protein
LGSLVARLAFFTNKWLFVFFDAGVLISLAFVFNYLLKKSHDTAPFNTIVLFFAVLLVGDIFDDNIVFILYLFFLLSLFEYIGQKSWMPLTAGAILSILIFYIKLNLGLIALAVFTGSLIYAAATRQLKVTWFILILLLYTVSLIVTASLLHVDLQGYLQGSLHLISGYNDAMYYYIENNRLLLLAVLLVVLFGVVLLLNLWNSFDNKNQLFVWVNISLLLYILFKQSFVRADEPHVYTFFRFITFPFAITFMFSSGRARNHLMYLTLLSLVVSMVVVVQIRPYYLTRLYTKKLKYLEARYISLLTHKKYPDIRTFAVQAQLPISVVSAIGNAKVDVFPTHVSYLLYNSLNYAPRPVIHSYSAYDPYLDSINARYIASPQSPRFLLLTPKTVDDRYHFFDESKTKFEVFKKYSVADTFSTNLEERYLLLKQCSIGRNYSAKPLPVISSTLNTPIYIPPTPGLLYYTLRVNYTMMGRLQRLLFQPPPLYMKIKLIDGSAFTVRAIKTILENGVLVNRLVYTFDDVHKFFSGNVEKLSVIEEITLYSPHEYGFSKEIEIVPEVFTAD